MHRSTAYVQRGAKKHPLGPVAGAGSGSGYADERVAARHLRDRLDEAARVRMGCRVVERVPGAQLDDAARVHDRDAARERSHDGEVVAHVERRDAMDAAEVAHGVEHVRLRRDVEPGSRLVEHDHAGAAGERHRQPDALLLAARELVGIAGEKALVAREEHLVEHLVEPLAPLLPGRSVAVRRKRLLELAADPDRRVERRGGILGNVGDRSPSERADLVRGQLQDLPSRRRGSARARSGRRASCAP